MDPQPIPYATPTRRGATQPPPPAGSAVLTSATVGWRTAVAAAWLAGVLGAAGYAVVGLYDAQQVGLRTAWPAPDLSHELARLAYGLAGPTAFAAAVGGTAAAVLYHWSAGRLAWAAALPAVAGGWSLLGVAQAGAGNEVVGGVLTVVAAQAAFVYAGTWVGRPLARWLTRRLVPPPLRASLIAVWV